jgi:hypothetical protein
MGFFGGREVIDNAEGKSQWLFGAFVRRGAIDSSVEGSKSLTPATYAVSFLPATATSSCSLKKRNEVMTSITLVRRLSRANADGIFGRRGIVMVGGPAEAFKCPDESGTVLDDNQPKSGKLA